MIEIPTWLFRKPEWKLNIEKTKPELEELKIIGVKDEFLKEHLYNDLILEILD
jgi:hypothetical protein